MRLGSVHTLQLNFSESGGISEIHVERAKRHISISEQFTPALIMEAVKIDPPEIQATDDFMGPLQEMAVAYQLFNGGQREISLSTGLDPLSVMHDPTSVAKFSATFSVSFDLVQPCKWALCFDEPVSAGDRDNGTTLFFGDGVEIAVAVNDLEIVHGENSVNFLMPTGRRTIEFTLTVPAWANISDTIVVCRSDQLREAAIVLAAIVDSRFVPLIVLAPPPMTLDELAPTFRQYRETVTETLAGFGALGTLEFRRKSREEWLSFADGIVERRETLMHLHPYRSWARRNSMLDQSVRILGIGRAILLCDPTFEEMAMTGIENTIVDTEPSAIDWSKEPSLLKEIERVPIVSAIASSVNSTPDFDAIYLESRDLFGNAGDPVEAASSDIGAITLGLAAARRRGHPLRLVEGKAEAKDRVRIDTSVTARNNHVVSVELRDHAQTLLSALYAAQIDAPLVAIPNPDLSEVNSILADLQSAVVKWASESRKISGTSLATQGWAAFRKYVYGDDRPELLLALEKAVTRQIPAEFPYAVGDAALTVFGSGLPYSFLHTAEQDWSKKAIGHVIADADLILLAEMQSEGAIDPILNFNLIVDSGYFSLSETDFVAEVLKKGKAKSLILKNDSQVEAISTRLLTTLPFELIFFNTHGSDNSILLGGYPLMSAAISQWMEFHGSKPIIFNNSCLSWTGVGKEFMRVGARGYIGTLWSVTATTAAVFAEKAMSRMANDGLPISKAILMPDLDPFTSRAYIYVGTASSIFSKQVKEIHEDDAMRLAVAMQWNIHILRQMRRAVNPGQSDAFTKRIFEETQTIRRKMLDRRTAVPAMLAVDAMLAELSLIGDKDDAIFVSLDDRTELAEQVNALLEVLPQGPLRDRRLARFLFLRAYIQLEKCAFAAALVDARASAELEDALGRDSHSAHVLEIQIAISSSNIDHALDLAERAYAKIGDDKRQSGEDEGSNWKELAVLGRLCQAMKRIPNRQERGIELARRGIALADTSQYLREQATFELDLAQLELLCERPQAGLEAALRALAIFRRDEEVIGELSAYGVIGQCYVKLRESEKARFYAWAGKERAEVLGEVQRVFGFLMDLGDIELLDDALDVAVERWNNALLYSGQNMRPDLWQLCLRHAFNALSQSANPQASFIFVAGAMRSMTTMLNETLEHAFLELLTFVVSVACDWPVASFLNFHEDISRQDTATLEGIQDGKARFLCEVVQATSKALTWLETDNADSALAMAGMIDQRLGIGHTLSKMFENLVAHRKANS